MFFFEGFECTHTHTYKHSHGVMRNISAMSSGYKVLFPFPAHFPVLVIFVMIPPSSSSWQTSTSSVLSKTPSVSIFFLHHPHHSLSLHTSSLITSPKIPSYSSLNVSLLGVAAKKQPADLNKWFCILEYTQCACSHWHRQEIHTHTHTVLTEINKEMQLHDISLLSKFRNCSRIYKKLECM